jgi:hypothetical protein
VDVPVVWPRGGQAQLHLPLAQGDGVLLLFSERSLAGWLPSGGQVTPDDERLLDLTDAIAVPGLNPFSKASPVSTPREATLAHGGGYVSITSAGRVSIGNSAVELLALLDSLLDALIVTTVPTMAGPQLLSKSLDTTLAQLKVKLALLIK